jgi:hypothetical protein
MTKPVLGFIAPAALSLALFATDRPSPPAAGEAAAEVEAEEIPAIS